MKTPLKDQIEIDICIVCIKSVDETMDLTTVPKSKGYCDFCDNGIETLYTVLADIEDVA